MQLYACRYELQTQLNARGPGITWLAHDHLAGERIVLKQLFGTGESSTVGVYTDETRRLEISYLFEQVHHLHHPRVLRILDYGFDAELNPFFTMRYLPDAHPIDHERVDLPRAIALLTQVIEGLTFLHTRGIVHGEIKPANILLHEDDVYISDYALTFRHASAHTIPGLLHYLAPEVLDGGQPNIYSDQYALGVLIYYLLSGELPFNQENLSDLYNTILNDTPRMAPLTEALTTNAHPLIPVILRLLDKYPDDRYPDMLAVQADFLRATEQPLPEKQPLPARFYQPLPFTGRLETLQSLVKACRATIIDDGSSVPAEYQQISGSLWQIIGESGVGKSRLVQEVTRHALSLGMRVLPGQAAPDAHLVYQVWREPLRRLVLAAPVSDLEAGILRPLLPEIETRLQRSIPEVAPLPGQEGRRRLFYTILRLLQRQESPLLIILEDAQHAAEGIDLLRYLSSAITALPVVVIVTGTQPLDLQNSQTIRPGRLNRQHTTEISYAMLGDIGRQEEILTLLNLEAEGNPFITGEVIRALADAADDLDAITPMTLPPTIFMEGLDSILKWRFDALSPTVQKVIQAAAVCGTVFEFDLLAEIDKGGELTGGKASLMDVLAQAVDAGIIESRYGRWQFCHHLMRDVILKFMPGTDYLRLNERMVEVIEILHADELHTPRLAHYAAVAGLISRATKYAIQAGDQARAAGNYPEALRVYENALVLLSEKETMQRATILQKLGDTCRRTKDYEQASEHMEMAYALASAIDDRGLMAACLAGMARIALARRDYQSALEDFMFCLRFNREMENDFHIARTLLELGLLSNRAGNHEQALTYLTESRQFFDKLQDVAGMARCADASADVQQQRGAYDDAFMQQLQNLMLREELGDRHGMGRALNELGYIARLRGEFAASAGYYRDSLEVFQEMGNARGIIDGLNGLGYAVWMMGDFAAANRYFEQSLVLCEEANDRWGMAICFNGMGHAATGRGDHWAAEWYYHTALTEAFAHNILPVTLEGLVGLARLRILDGAISGGAELIRAVENHDKFNRDIRLVIDHINSTFDEEVQQKIAQKTDHRRFDTLINELMQR